MSEHNPAFTQDFEVEIMTFGPDASPTFIAPALTKAITGWEREFNEEDEDDTDIADSFSLPEEDEDLPDDEDGDDSDDDSDEDGDSDDGDEEDGFVVEDPSDSVLNLVTPVNAGVLADIKAIQAMDSEERIVVRVIYSAGASEGNNAKLIRQFTVAPDLGVVLMGGDKSTELLQITLVANVFDSETIF